MTGKREAADEGSEGQPLLLLPESECEYPTLGADGKLTFRFGSPGERYYLGEQGVHAGNLLEMRLDDGAWTHVRFEWNPHWQEPPVLIADEETAFRLEDGMRFRWQKSR
jgi:hypothetical protein